MIFLDFQSLDNTGFLDLILYPQLKLVNTIARCRSCKSKTLLFAFVILFRFYLALLAIK